MSATAIKLKEKQEDLSQVCKKESIYNASERGIERTPDFNARKTMLRSLRKSVF